MSARFATTAREIRREILVNAAPALQIALLALLPFLPFLLLVDGGKPSLASQASFYIAFGCILVALLSRWFFFVFALVFVPLSVLSIHLVLRFGSHESGWQLNQPDSRVETYFESPSSETMEYFHSHWWPSDTTMLAVGVAYLAILAWAFATRPKLSRAAKATVAVALVAWAGVAVWRLVDEDLEEWPQYQLLYAVQEAQSRYARLGDRQENLALSPLPTQDCTGRYRKVVIVLGESAAAGHMSAFGYDRPTTPFADNSRPYLFYALAPANQTRVSLSVMLSPIDAENYDAFFTTPSLVSRLAACGYRTLWISNQGRVGRHDSFVSSMAREADQQVFLNDLSYKDVHLDGAIVDELERRGAFEATKQATFIHLIGSHTAYEKRYPPGFGFPGRGVVDAYDNSILYTDSVLQALRERFGEDGVLFIYVSDHGEVVSDKVFGHGFTPGYQEEYRTPLMIWTQDHVSMRKVLELLGGGRLNLESFDDVVSYLVGLRSTLRISTGSRVSNLAAGNTALYDELASFDEAQAGSEAGK